jgi:hypothetical protein
VSVSSLTANAVPPHRFEAYHWLLPVGVPHPSGWHYGLLRGTPHPGSLRVDPATLDPALRPLVMALHQRGIRTLPSCEGHFSAPKQTALSLARRRRDLQAQAPLIWGSGLLMRDVESGNVWRIQDPTYKLPSPADMLAGHYSMAGVGYLGILTPPHRIKLKRSPYLHTQMQPNRVNIWVSAPNARIQRRIWGNITKDILEAS